MIPLLVRDRNILLLMCAVSGVPALFGVVRRDHGLLDRCQQLAGGVGYYCNAGGFQVVRVPWHAPNRIVNEQTYYDK